MPDEEKNTFRLLLTREIPIKWMYCRLNRCRGKLEVSDTKPKPDCREDVYSDNGRSSSLNGGSLNHFSL